MMKLTLDTILVTGAGVVLLAAQLARTLLWRHANRPQAIYTPGRVAIEAGPAGHLNDPYVSVTPHQLWTERDWRALHIAEPRPDFDYEGLAPDDESDGDAWIAQLRTAGYSVELVPMIETSSERAEQLAINAMFERFDRMTTRGMAHVDTICSATIDRWQDEWQAFDHDGTGELERVHDWINDTLETNREFQAMMLAEALLIS